MCIKSIILPTNFQKNRTQPLPPVFCPLLKKSSHDPYLKFLEFSQHLVADTPMKKQNIIILLAIEQLFATDFYLYYCILFVWV